ncbi:MAG: helix-turn-helix domain-containing protein [Firmicutes bacterium]|nr:helix-turn-helix domain-containing protein [Bacillota bacterium]
MNKFKVRLREIREEGGLFQAQVADALGIARATYSNWEQGRREPGIDGIVALVNFFNVSAGYLIGTEN